MQPYGAYPQQPYGTSPPPPGAPQQGVANNPFAAAGGPASGGAVRSSPFGAAGAAAPPPGPPVSAPFAAPSGGLAPPPMGGLAPPPTADMVAQMREAPPVAAPPGPPPLGGMPAARPEAMQSASAPKTGLYPAASAPQAPGLAQQPSAPDAYTAAFAKDLESFNSPPHFVRSSVSRLPNSASGRAKTHIPLGVILQPLATLPPEVEQVPSVCFGNVGTIVRCRNCRTYINPFVQWEAGGRRWHCNLCGSSQVTPDSYYCSLDETGKRADRYQRPELHKGAVEYIAPGEYMVRPPQPPVFVFAIDVSYTASVTGMVDATIAGIKDAIQSGNLPGGQRTKVGFITFDTALHFYNLNSSLSQPQMLVVSDLDDLFLPLPDDILVDLHDNAAMVMNLLDSIPQIFKRTEVNESCMGSAIKGAFMAMKNIGGKLLVFGACIPSVGELCLKSTRDNPRWLGSDKEVELLRPVNDGYRDLATELSRAQISVELFVAPQQYIDLASIVPIAKYTGGDVRYYPNFNSQFHGEKLRSEVIHALTRYMGWEAVMRIRVSRGWKITNFYGHLYIRGTDLLIVPNCHSDQTFAITIDMEENVTPDPVLFVQSALLYTNSEGERRIRVHTWAALTTQNFADIVNSVDVQATTALLSYTAIEQSMKTTLAEGRNKLHTQCQQLVQDGNMVPTAEGLQFLPLYILGMLKSAAFRPNNDTPADFRTYVWSRLGSLNVSQLAAFFYPRMLALHNMPENCGIPDEHGRVTLPNMLSLTSEQLSQDGMYLLDDGESMLLWIGGAVDPNFLQRVFSTSSLEQLDTNAAEAALVNSGDPVAARVAQVIRQVRAERPAPYMQLNVIRHGEQPKEARFFASLIEDKTQALPITYNEFLQRMGYRPQSGHGAPIR